MEGTREPWKVLEQSVSVSLCTSGILAQLFLCEGPSWALGVLSRIPSTAPPPHPAPGTEPSLDKQKRVQTLLSVPGGQLTSI